MHLNDSADYPCSIALFGNDKQGGEVSLDNAVEIQAVKDSVTVTKCNSNLAEINKYNWELTQNNTIKNKSQNNGTYLTTFSAKKGQTIIISLKLLSKPAASTSFSFYKNDTGAFVNDSTMGFGNIQTYNLNQVYTKSITLEKDSQIRYSSFGNANSETFEFQFWAEVDETTNYEVHEKVSVTMPVQQEMLSGDKFVKVDGVWKEMHTWGMKSTLNNKDLVIGKSVESTEEFFRYTLAINSTDRKTGIYLKTLCTHFNYANSRWAQKEGICGWEAGYTFCLGTFNKNYDTADKLKTFLLANDVKIYYELAEPVYLDCTQEQMKALEQLDKFKTYKHITNLTTDSIAILDVEYKKDLETIINNMQAQILA